MATASTCPVVIKVQLSSARKTKTAVPPVAARLQQRDFPARNPLSPEAKARKELLIANEKARKAAIAAAHNERVTNRGAAIAQMHEATSSYLRETIDRRLRSSQARRMNVLDAKKGKAHKVAEKATKVQQTLDERKVSLAAAIDHSLEAANQKRTQQLRNVQFKAANVVQKHKAVVTGVAKSATELAAKLADSLHRAEIKRAGILSARAEKAAAFNAHHQAAVQRVRTSQAHEAKQLASQLQSKMEAAEYLAQLSLRVRQSKASIANEHFALVVSRRKLSDAVSPMIKSAKIRAEQYLATERRQEELQRAAAKAGAFVQRAVRTVAAEQVRTAAAADAARVNLQQRLADASARKEEQLHSRREHAAAVTSPRATKGGRAASPAVGAKSGGAEEADWVKVALTRSAPTSPVCGAPAC